MVTVVGLLTTVAAASAAGVSKPQRRQLAVTTFSNFKVVLTATREPGHPLLATVTAAGFRRSSGGWHVIAVKRIGKAGGWFWFSVQTCSLKTSQLRNNMVSPSPPVVTSDSIKVSLLITPAIGCSGTFSKRWPPSRPPPAVRPGGGRRHRRRRPGPGRDVGTRVPRIEPV